MTLMTFEPVSLMWGGPLCLHFTSVVCIRFYFRYKDLIIPTLGDKKKLSPEEKCRSVLQQTKLQGWQVCACVVCFRSYSVQINPTDLPNALIPGPPHKSFRGICDYSFQLSYLIIILIREHTHINPAPLSLLSGTLLLCLGVWPYRSHQLPSHTRTHTPPQWQADAHSYRLLYITHTYSSMCWNDCFLQPMLAPRLRPPVTPPPPDPLPTIHTHLLNINGTSVSQSASCTLVFVLCIDGQQ